MTSEQIQEYTFRITCANQTQLMAILHEMTITYIEDAIKRHEEKNREQYRVEIRRAKNCMEELVYALPKGNELAKQYYRLYTYVNRQLIAADVKDRTEPLKEALKIMTTLKEAYEELAKRDTSGSVMSNTQSVYAGLTYKKGELMENLMNNTGNRGFLA